MPNLREGFGGCPQDGSPLFISIAFRADTACTVRVGRTNSVITELTILQKRSVCAYRVPLVAPVIDQTAIAPRISAGTNGRATYAAKKVTPVDAITYG